jgi:hypothetical protein
MSEPIRTTRLEVPMDANGLPVVAAIEAGEITGYVRSTRLYVPVTEDINGNKIPVVAVVGGRNTTLELFTLVEKLPATGDPNKIYFVPHPNNEGGENNQFYECIWINNAWETIGTLTADTSIDLENYYTKSEVDDLITSVVQKVAENAQRAEDFADNAYIYMNEANAAKGSIEAILDGLSTVTTELENLI